ncbi:MAG: DUF1018 domain-containing protein [Thauera sp.]|jgi:hypothetical protein|nr:DUF1018 domain-containing protein [Thauera sp.]
MSTQASTAAQRIALRKRAIFAAAGKAGIDLRDAAERGRMVLELTGGRCASLSQCSLAELNAILDHLNRGREGYAGRRRVTPSAERAPLLSKVDALLAELHRVTGDVKPLSYADGVARRVCKRTSLDFCDPGDLKKVIAALASTLRHELAKRVP